MSYSVKVAQPRPPGPKSLLEEALLKIKVRLPVSYLCAGFPDSFSPASSTAEHGVPRDYREATIQRHCKPQGGEVQANPAQVSREVTAGSGPALGGRPTD